ncbi:cyclic nucleotide-binding domain-containing protein [Candidatus Bipolaricaulota bacterium]|nr:cyclic nucleotide-binding domain-containing protein [Candidatus Bipolaricaulota bacterium]
MSDRPVDYLKEVPLFSSFSKKQLKSVVKTAKEKEFEEGDTIVREGEATKVGFYLILDGQVEVKRGDKSLAKLGSGQFFGEMAVLDEKPRSADVIAITDTKCLLLTNWDFKALIKTYPEMAMNVISELASRLRQTSQALTK